MAFSMKKYTWNNHPCSLNMFFVYNVLCMAWNKLSGLGSIVLPFFSYMRFSLYPNWLIIIYLSLWAWNFLLLYVDDTVPISSNLSSTHTLITQFSKEFSMKDLDDLYYFLSVKVQTNEKGLFLSQIKYTLDLLQWGFMTDARPISIPFVVGQFLSADN